MAGVGVAVGGICDPTSLLLLMSTPVICIIVRTVKKTVIPIKIKYAFLLIGLLGTCHPLQAQLCDKNMKGSTIHLVSFQVFHFPSSFITKSSRASLSSSLSVSQSSGIISPLFSSPAFIIRSFQSFFSF